MIEFMDNHRFFNLFNATTGRFDVCIFYANINLRFMTFLSFHVLMDTQVFNPSELIIQKMYLSGNKDIFE